MRGRLRQFREQGGYATWERRTDPPLLILALLFVVVLGLPLLADLPQPADLALSVANVVIWVAFAVDYVVRLYLSLERWSFVRTHPIDLLIVLVPFLRPLRALRLLRLARLGITAGVAQKRLTSLHARVSTYVGMAVALVILVAALGIYDAERDAPEGNIKTFPDALWWAATTVTTVGYGDRFPTTGRGRLIAVALMVVGIALLGVITATIAAWFVNRLERVEAAEQRTDATLTEVLAELRRLHERLDEERGPVG